MKLMIASDIHGSAYYCRKLLQAFEQEKPDKLVLLGDILYHGPRNDLPKDYAPKEVITMLNEIKSEIICIRGNCDSEVDQMVLEFPIMSEQGLLYIDGKTIYITHGHKLDDKNTPMMKEGDVLLCGHTHVPKFENRGSYTYMNAGSVSIPKEGSAHSYMIIDDKFHWKDLDGNVYMEHSLQL